MNTQTRTENIKMSDISIGMKVNYINSKFMKNGIVTGFNLEYGRIFITWPIHGASSILITNIEVA
jgi:hypothetical protein